MYSSGMPVKYVIYTSRAIPTMDAGEVGDILLTSRMKNQTRGVTGALLYREGTFLQILEGAEDVIGPLVERIRADARHTDFTIIFEGMKDARDFAEWSMVGVPADAAARSPALRDALSASSVDAAAAARIVAEAKALGRGR